MQIIELERDDWNFHCSATGRLVFTEDGEPNTPALRGSWCHEVPEEPMHLADELQPRWQAHLEAQAAAEEGADVVAFLRSVERPNWVAFEITTCGMACGPVWNTTWTVLDLSPRRGGLLQRCTRPLQAPDDRRPCQLDPQHLLQQSLTPADALGEGSPSNAIKELSLGP